MRTTGFRTRELYFNGCTSSLVRLRDRRAPRSLRRGRWTPRLEQLRRRRLRLPTDDARRLLPHAAARTGETFALDRVVNDGPWPGSRTHLVDPTNLGTYLFEVRDASGATALLARLRVGVRRVGDDRRAEDRHRTFHESLRFPWPREPVTVVAAEAPAGQQLRAALVDGDRSGVALREPRRRQQHRRARSGRCSRTARRRRRSTCW